MFGHSLALHGAFSFFEPGIWGTAGSDNTVANTDSRLKVNNPLLVAEDADAGALALMASRMRRVAHR